ncbi:carboxypeptidase-like regulatory domain-containing protein [Flagellimonas marina]|uniref:Carboxypeptidase-like regulatory domain-containing protein n=1 Tax=Flagellimonas marina TaxID=1775168 RepID=A0ABV8PIZ6_9FLAO
MVFKGKVIDKDGQPLIGAHVTTQFRPQNVGTTTDFYGEFIIGDARSDESWKISHLGYADRYFRVPKGGGELTFTLDEKAFELDGVVLTPGGGTPGDKTFKEDYQDILDNLPMQHKGGFWDRLKKNPLTAVGVGLLGALAIGALMSYAARQSDRAEAKRLAKA